MFSFFVLGVGGNTGGHWTREDFFRTMATILMNIYIESQLL